MSGPISSFDLASFQTLREIVTGNPRVSEHSHWHDDIWYIDGDSPGYRHAESAIHWTIELDEGLLNQLKCLAALLFLGRHGHKVYKHSTASTFSAGARHLARFMAKFDYATFEQLDETAFELYKREIHTSLIDASALDEFLERAGDDATAPPTLDGEDIEESVEDPASFSAAYYRLRAWKLLCEYSDLLSAFGIEPPRHNPFTVTSPMRMAAAISSDVIADIPPLPDEVAAPILAHVHQFIATPADDIMRLQQAYLSAMGRIDREPPTAERKKLRAILESFNFSTLAGHDRPWRDPIILPSDEPGGGRTLRRLVRDVRDACILVMLSDTGIRIGEVCSPSIADREIDGGLPSCISISTSKTELSEHFFLDGLLVKHQEKAIEARWLLGARPVGSKVEPPTVRAVRVLERLLQPWRRLSRSAIVSRRLLVDFRGGGLPRSSAGVVTLRASRLRLSMQGFIAREVNLAQVLGPSASIGGELAPYARSNGRCIRPHQWRKTFLRYLMRVDEGLLPAISHHFKHYSLAITEDGYMPRDPALLDAADSVRTLETARFLFERRHARPAAFGKLDQLIEQSREELDQIIGDRPFSDAMPDLASYVREHDLLIWKAPHGRCMVALAPDEARCHEVSSQRLDQRRSPNLAVRTPALCAGCSNFLVGPDAIDFWRKRFADNNRAWLGSGRHPSFRVAEARANQATAILRALSPDAAELLMDLCGVNQPMDGVTP